MPSADRPHAVIGPGGSGRDRPRTRALARPPLSALYADQPGRHLSRLPRRQLPDSSVPPPHRPRSPLGAVGLLSATHPPPLLVCPLCPALYRSVCGGAPVRAPPAVLPPRSSPLCPPPPLTRSLPRAGMAITRWRASFIAPPRRRIPPDRQSRPSALGADEIAARKGQGQYKLVLVDLDRRVVIEQLPDRRKETPGRLSAHLVGGGTRGGGRSGGRLLGGVS